MIRTMVLCAYLALAVSAVAGQTQADYPSFDYETARAHQIKPHRGTIPHEGIGEGFHQLHLKIIVLPTGDVVDATVEGDGDVIQFWPDLRHEVLHWKYVPFEENGKPVTAEVEEYLDLVPPERLPKKHVPAPAVRPDSNVSISLERSGCFGTCPSYTLTVSTTGIVFDGGGHVVAAGRHTDTTDASEVRELAKKFVAGDFYSLEDEYQAGVTDNPTYVLSIEIGGQKKRVIDYVGSWVGMPQVISDLEDQVDTFARADRWIKGNEGLVPVLQAEGFNLNSFTAQVILKEAATRGETDTVQELLAAGVPLEPLPAPKPKGPYEGIPFDHEGWLTTASRHPEVLRELIGAGASKNDQGDKDLALFGAAKSGNVEGAKALIAYGANPNMDLRKLTITEEGAGLTLIRQGSGSLLIAAAESGKPEMVRLILQYHPNLEARDAKGRAALFAAGDSSYNDKDGDRVECVRLLARAGENLNARDNDGNTPLHETFLEDVIEELIKDGADVNARNNKGETPIFTNVSDEAMQIFVDHGADLTVRNKDGETLLEAAAREHGQQRVEVLQKAIRSRAQD